MPWKRRLIALHITQFEPLCCDDAGNLQDILEMHIGIPGVEGIFLTFDGVGEPNEQVLLHQRLPLWLGRAPVPPQVRTPSIPRSIRAMPISTSARGRRG